MQTKVRVALAVVSCMSIVAPALASQLPDKMCTRGFDGRDFLLNKGDRYELHVGKTVEILDTAGSVGTGANGVQVLSKRSGELEVIYDTEITMFSSGISGDQANDDVQPILIFRDRVFWPCLKK